MRAPPSPCCSRTATRYGQPRRYFGPFLTCFLALGHPTRAVRVTCSTCANVYWLPPPAPPPTLPPTHRQPHRQPHRQLHHVQSNQQTPRPTPDRQSHGHPNRQLFPVLCPMNVFRAASTREWCSGRVTSGITSALRATTISSGTLPPVFLAFGLDFDRFPWRFKCAMGPTTCQGIVQ